MSTASIDSTRRHDAEVISLIGLAHGTSHFFHLMLPPLFPWLMADFSLSYTRAGFLMTVFFVVSGIGQALAGFAVAARDRSLPDRGFACGRGQRCPHGRWGAENQLHVGGPPR